MNGQDNGIVVGVDGSPASATALRWAIARAAADRCPVTAVEVHPQQRYQPGRSYAPAPYGTAPTIERPTTRLGATVAAVVRAVPDAPEIVKVQLHGEPGVELARVAENASMLVLGHNPHGRVAQLLLGRVTGECLLRVRRPVVLIPSTSADDAC